MNSVLKILISALIFLVIAGCSGKNPLTEKQENPAVVNYFIAGSEHISLPINSHGILTSKLQSNLSFLTGGIIRKMEVKEGERVKEGQLLAGLDMTEIISRYEQAGQALEKAERDFKRISNLLADSVATLEQYQDLKTVLEISKSNYRIAGFNKQYSEIRAPSDGRILKILKEVNEITAPGYPVFVFSSREKDWVIRIHVADRDIVRLSNGDSASILFDAFPGKEFRGEVSETAAVASLPSNTYEVEIKLNTIPEQLVSGLIAEVRIFPQAEKEIIIPADAVTDAREMSARVFIIKQGRVRLQEIYIKEINELGLVISSGVNEGDTLVTKGNRWLKEGEKVRLKGSN